MTPLRLRAADHAAILGHCYDGLPDEACGLLIGPVHVNGEPVGPVSEVRPCRNADASARTYTVDPRDLLAAMRAAEARGEEIVGVWHSHTHTAAFPSPTDVRQAADPTWAYVIVSLAGGVPVLRSYRIRDGAIAEMPVEVTRA